MWAIYLNSVSLYEWVNTSNPFGVSADHFCGRGVLLSETAISSLLLYLKVVRIETVRSSVTELPLFLFIGRGVHALNIVMILGFLLLVVVL